MAFYSSIPIRSGKKFPFRNSLAISSTASTEHVRASPACCQVISCPFAAAAKWDFFFITFLKPCLHRWQQINSHATLFKGPGESQSRFQVPLSVIGDRSRPLSDLSTVIVPCRGQRPEEMFAKARHRNRDLAEAVCIEHLDKKKHEGFV